MTHASALKWPSRTINSATKGDGPQRLGAGHRPLAPGRGYTALTPESLTLRLGDPVRAVLQIDTGVVVRTDTGDVEARYAILTTPPGLTEHIAFQPPLTEQKASLISRQKMGSCIKVWVAYERPFWRDQGSNALFLSDSDDFTPITDATPPGSDIGVLAGFFDAAPARRWTHVWSGYIEGAIRSGERAATEVLERLAQEVVPA